METASGVRGGVREGGLYFCYECHETGCAAPSFSRRPLPSERPRFCGHCGSEAIELVRDPGTFRCQQVFLLEPRGGRGDSLDAREARKGVRTMKKTVRLPLSDPFVRETLIPLFPHVFRRASIQRIEVLRSLFQALQTLDSSLEAAGPADPLAVQSIPRLGFGETGGGGARNCAVCTEDFAEKDTVMRLECSHLFHEECLLPWLETNNTCPMCRSQLR
mgnify:CR=1 FL=1